MVLDFYNSSYRGDLIKNTDANSEHRRGRLVRTPINDVNYTALQNDVVISYTALSVGRTVTLPDATTLKAGKTYIVIDETGSAGANNITVDGNGAQTINGSATHVISTNYGVVAVITNGANWFVMYTK